MKTKIILFALVATFALSLFSSCSNMDCYDEIKPTKEFETEVEVKIEIEKRN